MSHHLHPRFLLLGVFALLCFFVSHAFAQKGRNSVLWTLPAKRPYTVVSYDLTLDWRKVFETHSPHYSAMQNISLNLTKAATTLQLDAAVMTIDTVILNGDKIFPVPQPNGGEVINIPIPQGSQDSGTSILLHIAYRKDTTGGFYFYKGGTITYYDSTLEDLAYTFSEPTDAHYWMPCNDRPDYKAASDISIIVPNGIEALSNGSLIEKKAFTPTSTLWHWRSDEPIVTYLIVADASKFVHWEETHVRSLKSGDTTHLDYYAWQKDYDDTTKDRSHFISRITSQIMTWFEARFGPFPFIRYGQVPVTGVGEGMEHQTLTTVGRNWLWGADQSVAHEMAHQWFGDKTTCESFKDIWLNEGFATFCEGIWGESSGGYPKYMKILRYCAGSSLGSQPIPLRAVYDPPDYDPFDPWLTYNKGGCVLHMLRRMLGDSAFFESIRQYLNNFAYTTATTAELRDFLSGLLKRDLSEFFDEWIFGAGQPTYDFKWAQSADKMLYVQVNQLQTGRNHFTMPLDFFAYHDGGKIDTISLMNNLRSQRFQTIVSYTIDSLGFDDDAVILCFYRGATGDSNYYYDAALSAAYGYRMFGHRNPSLKNDPALSVGEASSASSAFRITRVGDELLCSFASLSSSSAIEIYNAAGMKLLEISVLSGEQVKKIDIHSLPSGMYFARLGNEMRKVGIVR